MTAESATDRAGEPRTSAWALALTAIVGAEFLLQLDGTVVNVALPTLQSDLGVAVAEGTWVPNAFFLAFGGLLLFAGRLGDVLGHRRVFLTGIGLVVAASLIAGLAPAFEVLLIGRVLQGAGAALAGPTGLALLAQVSADDRRERAFGLYSTVTGLGASAGLILGGLLTWAGDWRWSLLVNVPLGLALIAVAVRALGLRDPRTRTRPLGLTSAVLVTATVGAAVYGLVHAAEAGWTDPWTIAALTAAAVLAALLVFSDARSPEPLLPLRVFASRERAGAVLGLLLLAAVLTGFLVYLVQYLQTVLGLDALRSGLAVLPFGLALLVGTQFLTRRLSGIDLRVRGVVGLLPVLAGVGRLTALDGDSTYLTGILAPIILIGLGVGVAIIPFNMIVLTTAPAEYAGVAAGLLQTALTIGGSLGLALLLVPYAGPGGPAENISAVFTAASALVLLALLITLLAWFGPRSPRTRQSVSGRS
ncbi:EmrB/QacA subfamily drug resistance transporter [Actinocorallia herbida]|uniref:EmrB/QacA subfamily drug resistance transporter n=1 Tax=Actinocorallia herbida TaxID=58109 RepID=A0A3N1CVB5_9ACTN|nr:MFS transporter [Actinocorallia herbida]ROO85217.1 EmrB/QacA subfamily drug resistance transporter [Actinocorallia herbida]